MLVRPEVRMVETMARPQLSVLPPGSLTKASGALVMQRVISAHRKETELRAEGRASGTGHDSVVTRGRQLADDFGTGN